MNEELHLGFPSAEEMATRINEYQDAVLANAMKKEREQELLAFGEWISRIGMTGSMERRLRKDGEDYWQIKIHTGRGDVVADFAHINQWRGAVISIGFGRP